jgi:flagellar biosynthesis/type III secretory pathway chaperone
MDARRKLEDVLDRAIAVAGELAAALADERTALTGNAPAAVTAQTARKLQLLATLENLEAERRSLCAAAGLNLPAAAPKGPVQQNPARAPAKPAAGAIAAVAIPPATVAERWHSLMAVVAGCRTANEVNGRIIHLRQGQIRQLIDIVRGSPAVTTYGPQGKTSGTALRALARA